MAMRYLAPLGWNRPGNPLMELHYEMDRLFDNVFGAGELPAGAGMGAMPRLEMCEEGDELCVSAELPGVQAADVEVRLAGDTLTISGEKRTGGGQRKDGDVHVSERAYGRFQRRITLPFAPDPQQTRANLQDGVLTVRLARQTGALASNRIPVSAGGAQAGASIGQGVAPAPLEEPAAQGRVPGP
ncbi:Hsp20/alpha crystallin family protein [Bordetella petrii]|uniref:Hsp20/alpha crystallin family protein n=1 Tax=Bordetella petrii TaxID=94624 RepID=UPI0018CBFF32|nr:Hsp20/alpha crystallin family protein [Bordetella petrii]